MQDPVHEITDVVKRLTITSDPTEQAATLTKYFHPDAAFDHPLCKVNSSHNSRGTILSIFQWYKTLSPKIELDVHSVGHQIGHSKGRLYLDVTQVFTPFFTPWRHVHVHLTVVLTLIKEDDGLWKISRQQDFYQPEDFLAFAIPGAHFAVLVAKHVATACCVVGAKASDLAGWWSPGRATVTIPSSPAIIKATTNTDKGGKTA